MSALRVGGLFSGIGGIELGLERAGMRVVWHCEQDEYCQRVLAKHWPGVPCYPDVTELKGTDVEPVDVLCGGFPCQDLSVAGKGTGLAGARSGLWSHYLRLIRELRPRYVVMENVAVLVARGLGTVVGDLAEVGYDAEWDCVPAAAVGAPHLRDRIYLVAYPDGSDVRVAEGRESWCEAAAFLEHDGEARPVANAEVVAWRPGLPGSTERRESDHGGSSVAVAYADEFGRREGVQQSSGAEQRPWARDAEWDGPLLRRTPWPVEPAVGRVVDGLPNRLDRCRTLGNAVVPQIPELIGQRIVEWESVE